jgi:hypothetical protein
MSTKMPFTRRQFLQALAVAPSGRMAPAVWSCHSDSRQDDYWSAAWALNPWSGVSLSASSVGFDGVQLEHGAVKKWCDRMHARGFVTLPSNFAAGIDLSFLRHPGDPPILDARVQGGQRFFILPATATLAANRWAEFGWCYEEWLARAIAGSFMTDFPRDVDLSDIGSVLGVRDTEERLCVAALHAFTGAATTAAVDAVTDAESSLASQGCEMDALSATCHGRFSLKTVADTARVLMDWAPTAIVGQDFESAPWPLAGVSVIATGFRPGYERMTDRPRRSAVGLNA